MQIELRNKVLFLFLFFFAGYSVAQKKNSEMLKISDDDVFVRSIVNRITIDGQEVFDVKFRLYSKYRLLDMGEVAYPRFNSFIVEDQGMRMPRRMVREIYNDQEYFAADFRHLLLFPTRSGKIKVSGGNVSMIFDVRTETNRGYIPVNKVINIEPFSVDAGRADRGEERGFNQEIADQDAFIRTIVEEIDIQGEKVFEVTFRLYTVENIRNVQNVAYPSFEDFDVVRAGTPSNRMSFEKYEGREYRILDLRKFVLVPKRSGKIEVKGGEAEVVFKVKTGDYERSFWGLVEKEISLSKILRIDSFTIDVGLIGDWQMASNFFKYKKRNNIILLTDNC